MLEVQDALFEWYTLPFVQLKARQDGGAMSPAQPLVLLSLQGLFLSHFQYKSIVLEEEEVSLLTVVK